MDKEKQALSSPQEQDKLKHWEKKRLDISTD